MGIFVWFGIGAAVGVLVAAWMPGRFPGGRSVAASAGAVAAFLSGALFAYLVSHEPKEFAVSTLPAAAVGAALFTFVVGKMSSPPKGHAARPTTRPEER